MPRMNRQTIKPGQLDVVACIVETIPQKNTTQAIHRWGGNIFHPAVKNCDKMSD